MNKSKTMPVSLADIYYTNENIRKYNDIMREVCEKNDVLFLDTEPLNNEDFDDGLHPNANGHKKIFDQIKTFLIENKWI